MTPKRGVGGEPSRSPCWWCSKQLAGWHGFKILVDGNQVVVHKICLEKMQRDPDFKNRVQELLP